MNTIKEWAVSGRGMEGRGQRKLLLLECGGSNSMYIYVCMYVCMYVCVYVCVYACDVCVCECEVEMLGRNGV